MAPIFARQWPPFLLATYHITMHLLIKLRSITLKLIVVSSNYSLNLDLKMTKSKSKEN